MSPTEKLARWVKLRHDGARVAVVRIIPLPQFGAESGRFRYEMHRLIIEPVWMPHGQNDIAEIRHRVDTYVSSYEPAEEIERIRHAYNGAHIYVYPARDLPSLGLMARAEKVWEWVSQTDPEMAVLTELSE